MNEDQELCTLSENALTSISNAVLCISSNTTVMQKRLFYSCLGMFNNSDNTILTEIKMIANKYKLDAQSKYIDKHGNLDLFEFDDADNLKLATRSYFAKYPEKRTFHFDFKELAKFWSGENIDAYSQYSALKKAVDTILDAKFINEFKDSKGNKHIKRFNIFSFDDQIESIKGTESISLCLNIDFIPYLIFLNEIYLNVGYTKTPLFLLKKKRREGSFAILNMLLRLYRKNGSSRQKFKMSIDIFRRYTDTENKLKKFNDLRKRFIDAGVEELNDDENISLSVDYIKKGRSFEYIVFDIQLLNLSNKTQKIDNDFDYYEIDE